jgi:CHAT domain-containing protein/tetratricopeptide (TPR) repeat protein
MPRPRRACPRRTSLFATFLLLLSKAATPATEDPAGVLARARELHAAGRLAEAAAAYRQVLAVEQAAPGRVDDRAAAANNLCVIETGRGAYREILSTCELAVELRRQALAALPTDATADTQAAARGRLARGLNNLGLVLQYLGRLQPGEQAFREALELNQQLADAESASINQSNLGLLLTAAGRYRAALAAHRAAAELASSHHAEPWTASQLAVAELNQGVVLERLGLYPGALEALRRAAGGGDALDAETRAALEVNTAVVLRNLGDPAAARTALLAAEATYRRLGDHAALSNVHLNLGLVAELGFDDRDAAEREYRNALDLATASGDRGEEARNLYQLGQLLAAGPRTAEATALLERCLAVATAAESPEGRWSALAALAGIAAASGQPARAIARLEQAVTVIEELRTAVEPGPMRWGFFGDKRSVYAAAIALHLGREAATPGQGHGLRALALAERAKARELLDALAAPETAAASFDLTATPDGDRSPISELLADGAVLLEQFATADTLYAWLIDRHGMRVLPARPLAPLAAAAQRTLRALGAGDEPALTDLLLLSDGLLPPSNVGLSLRDPGDSPRRGLAPAVLFVAADGPFRSLPFEILPPAGTAGRERLVDRTALAYLPTGLALAALRGRPTSAAPPHGAQQLLGIGAPTTNGTLPALPAADQELDTLAAALPPPHTLLRGAQATEAAWRRAAAAGARVIHVATHALVDADPTRGAGVVLTPDPAAGPAGDRDGLLVPEEIARTPIATQLVVLAGCRTARGGDGEGRAMTGLTGSFLAAGSPAVIASLWDVGDEATAAFMSQLYFELARGATAGEGLQAVKRRLRADPQWDRAALWAPFVLIGDPTVRIVEPPPRRWPWWLALGGSAAILVTLAWRLRGRSSATAGAVAG